MISSVGQDIPCARGILWEHLCWTQTGKCSVKLSLALQTKKETTAVSWLVPLLMGLQHTQTRVLCATLLRAPVNYAGELLKSLSLQASLPHFGVVLPPSIRAIPKKHNSYRTVSASMKLPYL